MQEFDKKCRNLVNFPMMGRSYAEVKPNLRGVPIMGYILLYQIAGNDITIVRVVNGHQDLTAQF
ncbi:type II toxin-antitoxin system RelE/ParE family toxin [Tumidithrix elongata]|uniref:type II toxin-antitoxin system RelE/ParE family toxin n=1 Tax=Tumidithrix elongata TaxID=3088357 RepID=UPI0038CD7DC5